MLTLELARMEHLQDYSHIIDQAKAFQRAQGFVQWTDEYPNIETIRGDIQRQKGYSLCSGGAIAGYLCIDFDGEPAYQDIQGQWAADEPYAVVHRMAFHQDFTGQGMADTALRLVEALCRERGVFYLRIDTDFPNQRMQHILQKNGFVRRGTIVFQGGDKIAFDKLFQREGTE